LGEKNGGQRGIGNETERRAKSHKSYLHVARIYNARDVLCCSLLLLYFLPIPYYVQILCTLLLSYITSKVASSPYL
jgi:hypothetical protein